MKAVITVVGKDMVGILARVSAACAEMGANVLEVTQSILEGYFCMVMVVDISKVNDGVEGLDSKLKSEVPDMVVHVMHEDIFNSMHRI